jgi:hypothetical protein
VSKLLILLFSFASWLGAAPLAVAASAPAAALAARHAALAPSLQNTPFNRPLVLESTETPGRLNGEIHAVLEHPFSEASAALNDPGHWCDILLLHINTKYCQPKSGSGGPLLDIAIGGKNAQTLSEASRMELTFSNAGTTPDHLQIDLGAAKGPMGTSDYRIRLEAIAVPGARTFVHFTYSYAYDPMARMAMWTYLNTVGAGKVGFTATGTSADGRPQLVGGMRGLTERNIMRYYLAIEAYLGSLRMVPAQQLEARLNGWYSAIESFPRQLNDVSRGDYLAMKRSEAQRQSAAQRQAAAP